MTCGSLRRSFQQKPDLKHGRDTRVTFECGKMNTLYPRNANRQTRAVYAVDVCVPVLELGFLGMIAAESL
jgi:hypothetical protein